MEQGRMSTIDLVDPELRPLLDRFPTRMLTMDNLAEARARTLPVAAAAVVGVGVETRTIWSHAGGRDVPAILYRPDMAGALGCIVHMHGGGFVLGSAEDMAPLHVALAKELGCVIVSVDYRLAPETSYPGNIDDCYDALAWTFEHSDALGIDASRIGVMGESAGGGLAAALALLARDRGQYRLAFQHLIYPMIDDRTGTSIVPPPTVGEFIWPAHNNRFGWRALLGSEPGAPEVPIYAAAARAGDLAGLPPTFISTGALDLFVEEDITYAGRLIRAGIAVELHVYPGAFHGFDLAPNAQVAAQARRDSVNALRRALRSKP